MLNFTLPNTVGVFFVLEIFAAPFGYEGASAIMNRQWLRALIAYVIGLPLAIGGLLALGIPIVGGDLTAKIGGQLVNWFRPVAGPGYILLFAALVLIWLGGHRFIARMRSAIKTAPNKSVFNIPTVETGMSTSTLPPTGGFIPISYPQPLVDHSSHKLELRFENNEPFVQRHKTNKGHDALYARVFLECNQRVLGCQGYLLSVQEAAGSNWIPTVCNEPIRLWFANPEVLTADIEPGIGRYLNIFLVDEIEQCIDPQIEVKHFRTKKLFEDRTKRFRFDIRVTDGQCAWNISLLTALTSQWDRPVIEQVKQISGVPSVPPMRDLITVTRHAPTFTTWIALITGIEGGLLVQMRITNVGPPTSIHTWQASYQRPDGRNVHYAHQALIGDDKSPHPDIHGENLVRDLRRWETGESRDGWIGIRLNPLDSETIQDFGKISESISFRFQDAFDNWHEVDSLRTWINKTTKYQGN